MAVFKQDEKGVRTDAFFCSLPTFSVFSFAFFLNSCKFAASLVSPLVGWAGGLIYKKDVFERLSLWVVNFANSYHHNRQMATGASAWCVSIYIII